MSGIEILVSTMDARFDPHQWKDIPLRFLVVNQCRSGNTYSSSENNISENLTIIESKSIGLSRSRNLAIQSSTEEICVIADDDLLFCWDISEKVKREFDRRPNCDVIIFQAQDEDGNPLRRYPVRERPLNALTAFNVISFEIAFRRKAILEKKIRFDERFGLGSEYVSGEENIFISDIIRSGLKVIFVPIVIVTHPGPTSGGQFGNPRVTFSKGAIIRRIFGLWSLPLVFAFAVKKRNQAPSSFLHFLNLMFKGWSAFR